MTNFGDGINTFAFVGTNCAYSKSGYSDAKVKHKWHDLAEENLQRAKDKQNKDRIKQLVFINKILCQNNEARAYINNLDKAIVEYY